MGIEPMTYSSRGSYTHQSTQLVSICRINQGNSPGSALPDRRRVPQNAPTPTLLATHLSQGDPLRTAYLGAAARPISQL